MEKSFAKNYIKDQSKFTLLQSSGGGGGSQPALKWVRFKNCYDYGSSSYWHPNATSTDAVIFKPKIPVYFVGFGQWGSYNKKDQTLLFSWDIGGEDRSEEYEVECPESAIDPEKKWHEFDIRKYGLKPILVGADQKIHCILRSKVVTSGNYMIQGYNGSAHDYKVIEG